MAERDAQNELEKLIKGRAFIPPRVRKLLERQQNVSKEATIDQASTINANIKYEKVIAKHSALYNKTLEEAPQTAYKILDLLEMG